MLQQQCCPAHRQPRLSSRSASPRGQLHESAYLNYHVDGSRRQAARARQAATTARPHSYACRCSHPLPPSSPPPLPPAAAVYFAAEPPAAGRQRRPQMHTQPGLLATSPLPPPTTTSSRAHAVLQPPRQAGSLATSSRLVRVWERRRCEKAASAVTAGLLEIHIWKCFCCFSSIANSTIPMSFC